jgi:phosphatidylserine/phosphatidylglycerophosphate/cardiolipin synthase-like enzyme
VRAGRVLLATLGVAWAATALWQLNKPLPAGTQVASPDCTVAADSLTFAADITAADAYGRPVARRGIFDEVLQVVRGARRFIGLDYELFGAPAGDGAAQRRLAAELTDALLERRQSQPDLQVLVITDPVSERYGTAPAPQLQLLRAAGVAVVLTDLDALRDPNVLYSSLWRLTLRWWGGPPGALGASARQLNFKANHRKLIVADDGHGSLAAVVGSANPLDRQSAWSNAALRAGGDALQPLLASELAIARFSGWRGAQAAFSSPALAPRACDPAAPLSATAARLQVLTEGAIRVRLLEQLDAAVRGDAIDIAAFALADRGLIEALLAAARRGVQVRLILDPSEDASSLAPSGLPNQPVASELVSRSAGAIHVRWYRTHGERFHSALAMVYGPQRLWLTVGSANFTRRSLADYDLEANLAVEVTRDAPLAPQLLTYFDTLWSNRAALGIEYTADFPAFADPSQVNYWLGRLLEGTGLSAL